MFDNGDKFFDSKEFLLLRKNKNKLFETSPSQTVTTKFVFAFDNLKSVEKISKDLQKARTEKMKRFRYFYSADNKK